MASPPAAAPPPESKSPSTNSTSPPSSEASAPPPVPALPLSSPPPSSPLPSLPPPSPPSPSFPPPSLPPPSLPPPSSPSPLHFSPPPALSPPPPASSPPPSVSSPPPQESSPPPPDAPLPAPKFLSPPPLSPNGSNTPPSPTLPPPLPSPPIPPSSPNGSTPPSPTLTPPLLPSPTPPSSFKPPPSSDNFVPPPPPIRPAAPPPPHSSAPSTNNNNVDSNKSSGGSDANLPMVAGIATGIALFFLIIGIVACVYCRKKKKKKKKPHNLINYNAETGVKGGDYYNIGPTPPKWNNGGQDTVAKLPPPPGMAWNASPTPPAINSENSVNYSGPNGPTLHSPSPSITLGFIKSTFSYEELAAATNGFSDENILGQGGFGYVHKGVLPNGQEVAVKQLKAGSGQGEKEFQAEVEIISRVHHRHLVSLVGYCIVGSQRLLVYEFVPNKTLEFHLHGKNQPTMDWSTRMRIALGSAKGLAYLHEDCHPRIIHRDIKASNILLDYKFEAKVADFGLAKLSSDNYTHISTRVMGTFGYLAPEYASSGKLTEKSDVFSFGVMLLELITGKRPVHSNPNEDSLVDWARPLLTQALTHENYDELVDPRLEGNYSKVEMARMVACAATSVRHSAKMRPKMSQIVRALDGDSSLEDLTEGVKPGQSMLFTSSSEHESGSYASNMSRFRRAAFDSNELSQEYSGLTSDYGLNPSSSSSSGDISTTMPHPDRAAL